MLLSSSSNSSNISSSSSSSSFSFVPLTSSLTSLSLNLLLFLFLSTVLPPTAHACKRLAFERCTQTSDCALGPPGADPPRFVCAGRPSPSSALTVCPDPAVADCVCYPTAAAKYCTRDSQCPDATFCARSARTGNTLCVGCLVSSDPSLNRSFLPVEAGREGFSEACQRRHAPCGQGLDFCSPTMPCNDGYECVFKSGNDRFFCDAGSSPCQCELPVSTTADLDNENLQFFLLKCDSARDCIHERETCVYDIRKQGSFCISCDALANDPLLILPNSNSTTSEPSPCEASTTMPRPAPQRYVKSPNGKTFDLCLDDFECSTNRYCVQFQSTEHPDPTDTLPCTGPDALCFCMPPKLRPCRSGAQCYRGESCMSSDTIQVRRKCVSNSFILSLSTRDYRLHGRLQSARNGDAGSEEACQYDWDCVPGSRCTYAAEPARFGGCGGRTACTCRRLENPVCSGHRECKRKEKCVALDGNEGGGDPFCISEQALVLFGSYRTRLRNGVSLVE